MGKKERKLSDEINAGVRDAFGLSAWMLSAELLGILTASKVLTEKQARRVIGGALSGIASFDEQAPHPSFKVAAEILRGQIDGWNKGRR